MEHSPNAAEGTLLGPTILYSTFKLILPCLCLSPIPQKSPGCSWLPGAVQSSSTEDQKEIKSLLSQSSGCANTHSWTQLQASREWEMEGPLQTSPLISKDDAINRTDEHLPSASEQGPWEG